MRTTCASACTQSPNSAARNTPGQQLVAQSHKLSVGGQGYVFKPFLRWLEELVAQSH
jgi:hypothetical protein